MNKKVIFALAFVAVGIISVFVYRHFSTPDIINAPSAGRTIVAFGDSLVRGVGADEGKDFVSRVAEQIGRPIINMGVPGDTTRDALTRLDEVLALKPDTVIVLLGGNDYLKRIPKEETFSNLGTIVTRLQQNGAAVLVLGVRGGALRDTYEKDFAAFARAHSTGYVSNILDDILGNRDLMFDQVHPNSAGYAIVANRVTEVLIKMIVR